MRADLVFYVLGALCLAGALVLGALAWRTQARHRGWVPWTGRVAAPLDGSRRPHVEWSAPDGTTHRMPWRTHAFHEPGTPVPLRVDPHGWGRAHVDALLSGGGALALAACLLGAMAVMFLGFGGMIGSFIAVETQP